MKITIIGGGIAGLTTAIALQQIGITATIFEAAPSVKAVGAGLALAANAMKGFRRLGIADEIIQKGRILPSFTLYDQAGKSINTTDRSALSQDYGVDNFTIHRGDLHQILYAKVKEGSLFLHKKAVGLEQKADAVVLTFQDGTTHQTDAVIVADGIHSPIRQQLLPHSRPRYAGYTCWRAVIDNTQLNLAETSETWGNTGRFGIVPLANNKIYWFACVNAPQNDPTLKQWTTTDLLRQFSQFHEPIPSIIGATTNDQLLLNDIIDLKPLPHYAFGRVVLIGDAAHATTPNMGQGACQAIEDAVVLADVLKNNREVTTAFQQFEKRRLKRTHWIINNSWMVGKIAQTTSQPLILLRNWAFRLLPAGINQRQFRKLYTVDF